MKRDATTLTLCLSLCSRILIAGEGQVSAATTPTAPAEAAAAPAEMDSAVGFKTEEWICKNAKNVRKVTLGFADIKTGSNCKVSYLKETEQPGKEKVLWIARNDAKFCQEHAQGFVEKLKGQGWSCE